MSGSSGQFRAAASRDTLGIHMAQVAQQWAILGSSEPMRAGGLRAHVCTAVSMQS